MAQLEEIWKFHFEAGSFILLYRLFYHSTENHCVLVLVLSEHVELVFKECHDNVMEGHFSQDRKTEKFRTLAWWPGWMSRVQNYFYL